MCPNEYINEMPDCPFSDNNLYYEEKHNEYDYIDNTYFNINNKTTYDEIVSLRDNLKSIRPKWMNTEEFINYENKRFKFYIEYLNIDNNFNNYNNLKTIGSKCCPLCRS